MTTTLSADQCDAEALVVEHDPSTREQLVSALQKRGYGVRACDTLDEGRAHFSRQAVVVTHANGDTAELRGFVDFVRQAAGPAQPFIVAVGEAESPSGLIQDRLGLDAFVPIPIENQRLASQIDSFARCVPIPTPERGMSVPPTAESISNPTGDSAPPADAPVTPSPSRPRNAEVPAMLEHFAPVLLDQMSQALAMFDSDMRYLAANQQFTTAFGLDQREIIGRSHYELFPDLHANWRRLFEQALAGEAGRIDEDFFQRADGTSDWVRWEVKPWHDRDGAIGGLVLVQEVITARKREERRRVFDRNLAVSLFESSSLPMLLVALDGRILRSSPAARAALGLQPTADGRMPFWEIYPDREQEEIEQMRFSELSPPPTDGTLGDYAPADIIVPGSRVYRLHWSASPHRNASGETQAILLIGSLIPVAQPVQPPPVPTSQAVAADHPFTAAAPSTASPADAPPMTPHAPLADAAPAAPATADLARHVPFGLVALDREGIVTACNPAASAVLGRPITPELPFEPWLAAAAPEDVLRDPMVREWRDNIWRRHMPRTFSLTTADGLLKEIEFRPRLLPDGHLLIVLTDVTESRRAEDAVRTSEAKYRGLFRELPIGIALADRTGSLIEGNPALEKLSGYTRNDFRRLRLHDLLVFDAAAPTPPDQPRTATLVARNGDRHAVSVTYGAICNPAGQPVIQACFVHPSPPAPATPPTPASLHDAPTGAANATATAAAVADATLEPPSISPDDASAWRDLAFHHQRHAVMVTDLRGRIKAANAAAARILGIDAAALPGIALYRLFRPHDPTGFSRDVSTHLNRTNRWTEEATVFSLDGQPAGACRAEITPVQNPHTPGLLCVLQPIFTAVTGDS